MCFWAWGGQCVGDILLFFFFEQAFVSGCTMKLAEMEINSKVNDALSTGLTKSNSSILGRGGGKEASCSLQSFTRITF